MLNFDNSYARLPERFYHAQRADRVPDPKLIRINDALAAALGIDATWLASPEGIAILAGNASADGAANIATAYAGHQFGHFNPQLGDGRALLLGEVVSPKGERFDVQLKGSGRTPFSRGGDGKSPLGPVLREYLISEGMHAMGIPTSRSLAAVTTGESVYRDEAKPGAVLTRVARSHIRVGTFEFFAARRDEEALRALADHVMARHYPAAAEAKRPYLALYEAIVRAQATLIPQWQLVGFIHGVMNTDNMLVSGETIDYGPCAFMDGFNPGQVYSSIDHAGRYAYRNQPQIAHWNLVKLAQAMLPILGDDADVAVARAQEALDTYGPTYEAAYREGLRQKFGLSAWTEEDAPFVDAFFEAIIAAEADFTLSFRQLVDLACPDVDGDPVQGLAALPPSLGEWTQDYVRRIERDPMDSAARAAMMTRANPVLIPRNHLVDEAIRAAEGRGDLTLFHRLVEVLQTPGTYQAGLRRYALPPAPGEEIAQTFCGT